MSAQACNIAMGQTIPGTVEHAPRTGYTNTGTTPEHAPAHSARTGDSRGEHAPLHGNHSRSLGIKKTGVEIISNRFLLTYNCSAIFLQFNR